MSRNYNQQESMRLAAEKVRLQREKEEREDKEFYERITSGPRWLIFQIVVVFCTAMFLLTTFDQFVDGPTKKISEREWKLNRDWEYTWHKIIEVEGYLFFPTLDDWSSRKENSLEIMYSPIFRTGKKLCFQVKVDDNYERTQVEIRQRSIFTWFPAFQLFMLIPLITYLFKRQSPWFNFARVFSLFMIFPGALMVIYFTLT